jgi:hypothetical protein
MRPRRRQSPWGHHIVALAQGGILRDRIMRRQVVVTDACSVERRAVTKRSWQFGIGLSGSRYGAVNIVRSVRLSINGSFSIRAKISAEGFLFGRAGTHCYDQPCRLLCPSRMCNLWSWTVSTLHGTWRAITSFPSSRRCSTTAPSSANGEDWKALPTSDRALSRPQQRPNRARRLAGAQSPTRLQNSGARQRPSVILSFVNHLYCQSATRIVRQPSPRRSTPEARSAQGWPLRCCASVWPPRWLARDTQRSTRTSAERRSK